MFLISCPYCGQRSGEEFTFERPVEAIVRLSDEPGEALRRLYTRTNPRGQSTEVWRHAFGCRAWLLVTRDTYTHEIQSVSPWEGRT